MTNELYKKDKAVICELSRRNRRFANVIFFVSLTLCVVSAVSAFFRSEDRDVVQVMTIMYAQVFWLTYYSFFLRSGGMTVFNGVKSASLARETFKGSTLFIDTLCGIPIRRESAFRYVMEGWYMMIFVYLISLTSMLVMAVTINAGMSLHAVIFAAVYFLWTFVIFLQCFAVTVKSKKAKKLLEISSVATIIFFSFHMLAAVFLSLLNSEGVSFALFGKISASVRLSSAAAVIIMIAAVIYPAVMELVFRKKFSRKKRWAGMSKAEYAAVRYMTGGLAIFLSAVTVLTALGCGFVNYHVITENTSVAFFLNYCMGMMAVIVSMSVMTKFYDIGGVLRVIPIKRERAAELCLAVCCVLSALPYITEMIFAFILVVSGKMSVGDAFAAASASGFAMAVTFYAVAVFFPHYSPFAAASQQPQVSYSFAMLFFLSTLASAFDGIIIRSHLSSGKPVGAANALPAVIAVVMMHLYPLYAKKSVQKALKREEAYSS